MLVHACHCRLDLGTRFSPSSEDARPTGYHQVQSGSTELVPVIKVETVKLVQIESCQLFIKVKGTGDTLRCTGYLLADEIGSRHTETNIRYIYIYTKSIPTSLF